MTTASRKGDEKMNDNRSNKHGLEPYVPPVRPSSNASCAVALLLLALMVCATFALITVGYWFIN